jgi:hypothetical protein
MLAGLASSYRPALARGTDRAAFGSIIKVEGNNLPDCI